MKSEIFNNLYILDLANNHFGDILHAKNIISKFARVIKKHKIKATVKFQFRDIDSYIHKDFVSSNEKYVKRFLSTRLSEDDYFQLFNYVKRKKFLTSCTPFDERSVDLIEKFKFDIIKIASASSLDFNLLERVTKNKIPKIISTGGKTFLEIDKIVSFFKKKKQSFALMHCVSIYPTPNDKLNINVIKELINRYKDVTIGWSTHENPNDFLPGNLAYTCGAKIFEKHIGINSRKFKLNNYSITPNSFEKWYLQMKKTTEILGPDKKKIDTSETNTLNKLNRGVYAKKNIIKGEILNDKNIYFAFPLQKNQLSSSSLKKDSIARVNFEKDQPIFIKYINFDEKLEEEYKIRSYIHELKAILNKNNITIQNNFDMEISHHKGIKNFRKIGCFLFNLINKKYAKKMIVLLPNQKHPLHFHKKKEESFHIISGNLISKLNGKLIKLNPGDFLHIKKNSWHEFQAGKKGCIFDEISTRNYKQDSYYKEKSIKKLSRNKRKTYINNWL
jgi:sialic acid synthase SpsE/quercetin dioxygenase-like cupin family protein